MRLTPDPGHRLGRSGIPFWAQAGFDGTCTDQTADLHSARTAAENTRHVRTGYTRSNATRLCLDREGTFAVMAGTRAAMASRTSHPPHISRSPISPSSPTLLDLTAPSDAASSAPTPQARYHHFSALRTTGRRQSDTAVEAIFLALRTPDEKLPLRPLSVAMSSACEECVQDCEQGTCEIGLTEQCTEQCVVVPCNDAHHDYHSCEAANTIAACDIMCSDGPQCSAIDAIMQCCPEYHQLFMDPRAHQAHHNTFGWPFPSDNLFGNYMQHDSSVYGSESSSSTPQMLNSPTSLTHTPHSASSPLSPTHPQGMPGAQAQAQAFACMWGNCGAHFGTLGELVGHVNLQHLRPAPAPAQLGRAPDAAALSCLWADCTVYPTPSSVPGPSAGNAADSALGVLASHLLTDHLGLPTPAPAARSASDDAARVSPPASGPPTPAPEHDCSAPQAHVCRWTGCGESFASCDALTQHINAAHVGSGKAHYDCYWEGCARHGDNGFASKQKICRHLQSHTGHRPFQCSICQQNFSEAATLAQHMRRHTQEKPYVCDYPGCGKSFAITGALTIHKRTHNGDKPFKCTYCDRAFTESSNLSKHLRTHTGIRPYPCTEPGCNKTFARPDQLARHMTVHRKKDVKPEPPAGQVTP